MKKLILLLMLAPFTLFGQVKLKDISVTNVADGEPVSIGDYASAKALVVIFTSNECAYDGYYGERLAALIKSYQGKVEFVLVNSYIEPADNAEAMKTKLATWNVGVPYLADKDQVLMETLGAKKSPEAFVLTPSSGFAVAYSGAIDDNPQLATGVKANYLKDAIDVVLKGNKPAVNNARAVGCSMRRK